MYICYHISRDWSHFFTIFRENRPERVAIPKKFYIGLRPGFIIVKQVVVDWVTGMVWDPNQEGCIDKFGGKILLSANQKKKHYFNSKKDLRICCMVFKLFKYVMHMYLYKSMQMVWYWTIIPFMLLIKIMIHENVLFLPWTNRCLFSLLLYQRRKMRFNAFKQK